MVAFIDEVEEVAAQRAPGSPAATAVVNELLKSLVRFRDRSGRLLVCATNSVRDLDTAFLRHGRFDYVLPIGPPDDAAREALWRRYIDDTGIDVLPLVAATQGYTPADVAHAVRGVAQATFERSVDTLTHCRASTEDYLETVSRTRPTLTPTQVSDFNDDIDVFARS